MKILVTGHKGYIGSCLAPRLAEAGHKVVGLDLQCGQDVRTLPITDTYDLIIHLAGKSGVRESLNEPAEYWVQNVEESETGSSGYEIEGEVRLLTSI